jgi:dienelactone hydrolase
MKRPAALLLLVWLALVASGCRVVRPDPPRVGPVVPAIRQDPSGVGTRTLAVTDASRGRSFTVRVSYPEPAGALPLPVLVFSHGLRGTPDDYHALIGAWVRSGLVVVAPAYPFTNRDAADIVATDLRNQPADASFALSALLDQAQQPGDALHGRLDANHVAAAGHSEGALTTYGLFTACCRDPRLRAGIVMAGDAVGFRDQPMSGQPAPLLFVHGDADQVVSIELGRAAYTRVAWPKAFLTLPGAGHIPAYLGGESSAAEVVSSVTTDFLRWTLRGDAAALSVLRRDATTAGASLDDHLE